MTHTIIHKSALALTAIIIASGALIASPIQAQEISTESETELKIKHHPIAIRIASAFNLSIEKVHEFFKKNKPEKRQAIIETRIEKAVEKGKITDTQAKLIIEKRAEIEAKIKNQKANFKEATPEERRAIKTEIKADIKAWAESNNINPRWIKMKHNINNKNKFRGDSKRDIKAKERTETNTDININSSGINMNSGISTTGTISI